MDKIEYRAYIKTRALLGITAVDITNELKLVHGDLAPEYSTVANWAALFKAVRRLGRRSPLRMTNYNVYPVKHRARSASHRR